MSAPRLLDLFCGGGGAAVGYHRAGFEVVGVDLVAQPRYPFEFHQADAITFPLDGFDAIHASPPCQFATRLASLRGANRHRDLLTPMRSRLQAEATVPWVIENVPGAPMRADVILCGTQFGLGVWRHRLFEFSSSPPFVLMPPCVHVGRPIGVYGHPGGSSHRDGGTRGLLSDWMRAMGIDWMSASELSQAIPPAYTEWIGSRLLEHVRTARADR